MAGDQPGRPGAHHPVAGTSGVADQRAARAAPGARPEPSPEELALKLDRTPERVVEIERFAWEPLVLDETLGDEGYSRLGDFVADTESVVAADAVSFGYSRSTYSNSTYRNSTY